MLTLSEIFEIVYESCRSFRRWDEQMVCDVCEYDRLFEAIRIDGGLTDEQWRLFDAEQPNILATNYTSANPISDMESLGFGKAVVDFARKYNGIVLFPDAIALHLYQDCPETPAEGIRKFVFFVLNHERRHSIQDPSLIRQEYASISEIGYENLSCEQDADAWASFQLKHVLG